MDYHTCILYLLPEGSWVLEMCPCCRRLHGGFYNHSYNRSVFVIVYAGFKRGEGDLSGGGLVGFGRGVGLGRDRTHDFTVESCWVSPGTNAIHTTGNVSKLSKEAVIWARAFVDTNCGKICSVFGIPGVPFCKAAHDLHIHFEHAYEPIDPMYQMAAVLISMISLLVGRRPDKETAVFGNITNEGILKTLDGWEWTDPVVAFCMSWGIRRVILPQDVVITEEAKEEASKIHEDGRPQVEILLVRNVRRMIPIVFRL